MSHPQGSGEGWDGTAEDRDGAVEKHPKREKLDDFSMTMSGWSGGFAGS